MTSPPSSSPGHLAIRAHINVGFGNELFIRGEGLPSLSWQKGIKMTCRTPELWEFVYSGSERNGTIEIKILMNDKRWQDGNNIRIEADEEYKELIPSFKNS